MKNIVILLVLMLSINSVFSQSDESSKEKSSGKNYATLGQDGQVGNNVIDPAKNEIPPNLRVYPYQWVDLLDPAKGAKSFVPEAEAAFIANSSDEAVDTIEMGMTFEHFGEKYTTVSLVINGFVALSGAGQGSTQYYGSLIGPNSYSPSGIPSPRLPNNIIAPFWVDIDFKGSKGYVFYRTFKPETNNRTYDHLIVQWEEAGLFADFFVSASDVVRVTFQTVLFTGGGILFQYKKIDATKIKEDMRNYPYYWNLSPDFDFDSLTDFDAITKLTQVAIGYEDKTGLKGASWDFSVSAGTALGNDLVPEWASGSGGDNFLNFLDGRDRRNNATTSSGGSGCFLSHKKAGHDR